jgi:dethiobiotin synthetase
VAQQVQFQSARGIFVTGTDTGVGKTVVAGAIAHQLRKAGNSVGVFKPIATGCKVRREGLVSPDAEFLAHCSDTVSPLEQINPVRYREPLAPLVAAERVQTEIDWDSVQLAYRNIIEQHDQVVVEGIGGVMVPIQPDYLVLDLMVDLALPVVIVARSGLGTINHTLLTLEACRERKLKVLGIVINRYQADSSDTAEETNPRVIAAVGRIPVISIIPDDKETDLQSGRLGSEVITAAGLANWADLIR